MNKQSELFKGSVARTSKTFCQRIVQPSSLERNPPEARTWWHRVTELLEHDASIPPEQQLPILQYTFEHRHNLLNKILKICTVTNRKLAEELNSLTENDITRMSLDARELAKSKFSEEESKFYSAVPRNENSLSLSEDCLSLPQEPKGSISEVACSDPQNPEEPPPTPTPEVLAKIPEYEKFRSEQQKRSRSNSQAIPPEKFIEVRKQQLQLEIMSGSEPLSEIHEEPTDGASSDALTYKRIFVDKETLSEPRDTLKAVEEEKPSILKLAVPEQVPRSKMYIDFFKRKPHRAAVWRPLPPLELSEMNLLQKAEAVTAQIANDFMDWLQSLGGDEQLKVTVQSIIEMFEIGFYADSTTSLKVCIKELRTIPDKVAEARKVPQAARRAVLQSEIRRDQQAGRKKVNFTAFGGHLPILMQKRPPAEHYYRKWISCNQVPQKLATMEAVWKGITHLKSTRAYCEFLLAHPEITPPKFLVDSGMMDRKKLARYDMMESMGKALDNLSDSTDT